MGTERKQLDHIKNEVDYYPHQLDGVREMARMDSFLLADEMGLGKSLQALTVAAIDFQVGQANRILVVCPATLKHNWQDEVLLHTHFDVEVLEGTPKKRTEQLTMFATSDIDVLIVNYEQVKPHVKELNALGFDICIMDEAHYIKNFKSQRTKAAQRLIAKRFMLLTGSPMLNHVNELWPLLHRIQPGEWPKYWSFVNRYCVFGGFKDKEIIGTKNRAELTERLNEVMIRRRKDDVLDLPPKQRIQVWVDLHPKQRKLYDQAQEELLMDLPGGGDAMQLENALTKFLRLKQLCSTTANLAEGVPDVSTKLDLAVERAAELIENGHRLGIFTQFRGTLRCLEERFAALGINTYALHGDVKAVTRPDVVKTWGESDPGVLVAMLQVAGVGLNMTQANHVFFVDKLFVPKLNEQAEDRFHRIGTTGESIQIVEFLARNTIESRIEKILARKTKVFGDVVESDNTAWKRKLLDALAADDEEEWEDE